jgi:hypothetical protein
MQTALLHEGQTVHRGDPIGTMGGVGALGVQHVHLQARDPQHQTINPLALIYDLLHPSGSVDAASPRPDFGSLAVFPPRRQGGAPAGSTPRSEDRNSTSPNVVVLPNSNPAARPPLSPARHGFHKASRAILGRHWTYGPRRNRARRARSLEHRHLARVCRRCISRPRRHRSSVHLWCPKGRCPIAVLAWVRWLARNCAHRRLRSGPRHRLRLRFQVEVRMSTTACRAAPPSLHRLEVFRHSTTASELGCHHHRVWLHRTQILRLRQLAS